MKKYFSLILGLVAILILSRCTTPIDLTENHSADLLSINKNELPANQINLLTNQVEINNMMIWKDTAGNEIKAQGGCIIIWDGIYHWFGPDFGGMNDYNFYAINHYVSTDFKNWTKKQPAFQRGQTGIPFSDGSWIGRPWVMWNPNDQRFVLGCEWGGSGDVRNQITFFSSPSIDGPWTYHPDKLVKKVKDISNNNNTTYPIGDIGFYSEGNTAWILYTFDKPIANRSQAILKLGTDFMTLLDPIPGNYSEFTGLPEPEGIQEAAGAFKRNGIYYYFTSQCRGWQSSNTRYRTATNMAGPWTSSAVVPTNPSGPDILSFNTQHDFVLPIVGAVTTTYVYCGDRWNNYRPAVNAFDIGKYAWFPLTFNSNGIPTINAPNYGSNGGDWILNISTGEWSATAAPPSLLQNGSFEDNFSHWTYTGNASIATGKEEVHTGLKAAKSWSAGAYTTTLKNSSITNCAEGNYTATVWARAGGKFGQRLFEIYVNGVKTNEIILPVTTSWTAYSISNINVPPNANIDVKISLAASDGAWAQFDDVTFIKN